MASVGRGEMKASDVARAMYPDYKEERVARYGVKKGLAAKLKQAQPHHPARSASVIPVGGINADLPIRFAPNGGAVPGDRIVGIITPGEGITIYPIQSPALKDYRGRAGALARRALGHRRDHAAALSGAHLRRQRQRARQPRPGRDRDRRARRQYRQHHMSRRSPDFTELTIDLEVYDLKHLSAIIAQLRAKAVVARVERVNG